MMFCNIPSPQLRTEIHYGLVISDPALMSFNIVIEAISSNFESQSRFKNSLSLRWGVDHPSTSLFTGCFFSFFCNVWVLRKKSSSTPESYFVEGHTWKLARPAVQDVRLL